MFAGREFNDGSCDFEEGLENLRISFVSFVFVRVMFESIEHDRSGFSSPSLLYIFSVLVVGDDDVLMG